MDTEALRIRELAAEACGLLCDAERGLPADVAGLEYLRALLVVLARETRDDEAADTARGVAHDVEAALEHALDGSFLADRRRGAA